jgi:hypothetical protein
MGFWWLDRVLPGFVAGIPIFTAGLWVQFHLLRRNLNQVTDKQTQTIIDAHKEASGG